MDDVQPGVTETPNGTRLVAIAPDGATTDVTEHVGAIYDLVIQSMDFGSGFLTAEDAVPLAELGRLCGYGMVEEAEKYLAEARAQEERERERERLYPNALRFALVASVGILP
jgi:hypothetical protein